MTHETEIDTVEQVETTVFDALSIAEGQFRELGGGRFYDEQAEALRSLLLMTHVYAKSKEEYTLGATELEYLYHIDTFSNRLDDFNRDIIDPRRSALWDERDSMVDFADLGGIKDGASCQLMTFRPDFVVLPEYDDRID